MVPKEKGELTPSLFLQLSDNAAPEQRSKGMEALQANHDKRPANPCERAIPFSTVHPYGPLARVEPKLQDQVACAA